MEVKIAETRQVEFSLNDHFFDFVHDWDHKIYLTVGGYGSSKSYHIAVKLIKKLLEEKRKALVVREVFDTIRDSCYDLLMEVAEAMEVTDYITFTTSPMQVRFSNGRQPHHLQRHGQAGKAEIPEWCQYRLDRGVFRSQVCGIQGDSGTSPSSDPQQSHYSVHKPCQQKQLGLQVFFSGQGSRLQGVG